MIPKTNPYNVIGELHNAGLNSIVQNLSNTPSIDEVVDLTSRFVADATINAATQLQIAQIKIFVSQVLNNQQFQQDNYLEETKISSEQVRILNEIINIPPSISNSDIKIYLEDIEFRILTSNITREEKSYPLLVTAVSKYSNLYWNEQVNNPESPWQPFFPSNPSVHLKQWLKADAQGAFEGGLAAGLYTWWTGGGILVAAGAGALAGGIASSLGSVIFG